MQSLEVSDAVRPIYESLGVKRLNYRNYQELDTHGGLCVWYVLITRNQQLYI